MLAINENKLYVEFCFVGVKAKTEKAVLVILNDGYDFWLPKSQIVVQYGDKINHFAIIPYYVADNAGLLNKSWNGQNVHQVITRTGKELKDYLSKHGIKF